MAHPITWSTEEKNFVLENHEKMTAKEMADWLDVERQRIYNICNLHGISAKRSAYFRTKEPPQSQPGYVPKGRKEPKKKASSFERPPAVYSNCSPMGIATEFRIL